ncbi:C4-dicarboxylate ABC transporter [Spirochaetia bacterium]|nr:C4-dicarboxylate ABC transporter [Spirochaetia bacterium]
MKRLAKCIAVVAAVTMFATAIGCSKKGETGAAKKYILKMSTQLNETNPMVDGFKAWAAAVEARTNGAVTIQVYPSAQLGSDEDVIEQALQGVNVAVLTDGGRMANYAKEIGIIGMPYIADDYTELRQITESPTFQTFDAALQKEGIRILSYNFYDGPRHFLTKKEIHVPADLKGLRIRTPGAPVWAKSVEAMGATPIAMGWNDAYNALQSQTIDGVEVQNTSAWGARMYEVVQYMNKTSHFQLANFVMVGEKFYQSLPEEYRTILMEECKKASYDNAELVLSVGADYEKQMVEKGMIVVEPDVAAFKAASEAAYTELGFADLRNQIWGEIGKR